MDRATMRRSSTGLTDVSTTPVRLAPPPASQQQSKERWSGRGTPANDFGGNAEPGPSRRPLLDWRSPLADPRLERKGHLNAGKVNSANHEAMRSRHHETRQSGAKKRSDVDRATLQTDWRKRPLYAAGRRRSISPAPREKLNGSKDWRDILTDKSEVAAAAAAEAAAAAATAEEEMEAELDAEEALRVKEQDEAERNRYIEMLAEESRWNDGRRMRPIKTGIHTLDDLLLNKGSACPRRHVEITGPPAIGKTSLAIRIAIGERLDSLWELSREIGRDELGSCWREAAKESAEVTILDTEGSLTASRVLQVARALVKTRMEKETDSSGASSNKLLRAVLEGVHLIRITTLYELTACLRTMCPKDYSQRARPLSRRVSAALREEEENRNRDIDVMIQAKSLPGHTSMIVIDSLSFLFRAPPSKDPTTKRARLTALDEVRDFARRVVQKRGLSIVFTNQMAFKVVSREGNLTTFEDKNGTSRLFAALAVREPQTGSGSVMTEMSILGTDVTRLLLFRAGSGGDRYVQTLDDGNTWIPYVLHYGESTQAE